ncbi:MAG: phosphoribosylformylglycinamidine synthase subunit PurQ [Candidatus Woesearchaeota archaeon]
MHIKEKPKVIIPIGIGINSHEELGNIFEIVGAKVDFKHINDLIENPNILDNYHGFGGPGGFTMGDQLGAGQSVRNRIYPSGLNEKLNEKLDDENFPMYIVCNFLQILAKLNSFPVTVGTTANDSGKHETNFWDTKINPNNKTIWLEYLKDCDEPIFAPISHGEGRIYVPPSDIDGLIKTNLIALTYVDGTMCEFFRSSRGARYNPNGSTADIAGFGWANNLVLFPHFERLHHDYQRPDRELVRREKGTIKGLYQPTYLMFNAAVDFMKE